MSSSLPAAGGMDDIDPLEAGPDIDPLEAGPDAVPEPDYTAMEREGDGIRAEEGEPIAPAKKRRGRKPKVAAAAESDDADAQAMAAVAVAAKGSKKSTALMRKRADPFMPKGSIAPLEWAGFVPLEEGCRAHMVREDERRRTRVDEVQLPIKSCEPSRGPGLDVVVDTSQGV